MLGAAHKPGAIALRPLQLGDMYDAAFRIIRFNPKATVGSAVLVTAVAMLIPVVVTAVLTWSVNLSLDPGSDGFTGAEAAGLVGAFGSLLLGTVLQSLGLILVTGMVAHVTMAAAVGKKLTLGEAWAATAGKRLKLVGLVLLLGLMLVLLHRPVRPDLGGGGDGPRLGEPPSRFFLLVSIPAFLARPLVVLDPHLLPAGAGADARGRRGLRGDRARPRPDPEGLLAGVRHRAADGDHHVHRGLHARRAR